MQKGKRKQMNRSNEKRREGGKEKEEKTKGRKK